MEVKYWISIYIPCWRELSLNSVKEKAVGSSVTAAASQWGNVYYHFGLGHSIYLNSLHPQSLSKKTWRSICLMSVVESSQLSKYLS